jgi:hypothetical protein
MRNKMDDKYKKAYDKRNEQFHKYKEKEEWHHEPVKKIQKAKQKPDPATVEAALRLEEELWAS